MLKAAASYVTDHVKIRGEQAEAVFGAEQLLLEVYVGKEMKNGWIPPKQVLRYEVNRTNRSLKWRESRARLSPAGSIIWAASLALLGYVVYALGYIVYALVDQFINW